MQLPLTDPDTLFEELLQDLPAESVQMARAFKAFVRAKKVKTPAQLLRVVFLYCGLDKSLREVAGTFTALYEAITDQSVAERLRAWGPWVQALLRQMFPMAAIEHLPAGRRFVVIDASRIQAPGATGTDQRLHIAMDLVSLQFLEVLVSNVHTGETLKHFTFTPGDIAVADRGYAQCQGMHAALQQGADLIVRLHPFRVGLGDATGAPLALSAAWKRQAMETLRTLEVTLHAAGGQDEGRGWVHAYRLHIEQANRARHTCRQGHKKGTPSAESLFLAGWVLVLTTLTPVVLSPQTILALYRCRWQVASAIKRWKSVLDVDALRAKANSPLAAVWLHGKLL
jgi:Transposase DDE domain